MTKKQNKQQQKKPQLLIFLSWSISPQLVNVDDDDDDDGEHCLRHCSELYTHQAIQ